MNQIECKLSSKQPSGQRLDKYTYKLKMYEPIDTDMLNTKLKLIFFLFF